MKTVHLMGIGGIGMVSLAGMFRQRNWNVRGSDQAIYPPASTELARLGVPVLEGYKPENLEPAPDLVVVGNVMSRGNPEVEALLKTQIPYTSMAQALATQFLAGRRSVVVTGTHGKTTTTSLLAWILMDAGLDPGLFVGGVPLNFEHGYRLGAGQPFVVEGDEYDTAFFEKTPKFLHYVPHDVIMTSVEFDHADIYRDLPHVREQFERLMGILPKTGKLLACGDHAIVREIAGLRKGGETFLYGEAPSNDWRVVNLQPTTRGTDFEVSFRGKTLARVRSPLLGRHNVVNALACFAMAQNLGVTPEQATRAIETFRGVRRRQEFLGEVRGARLYDDFAHHPTAIAATLEAFSPMAKAGGGKLWAVFEPRSNTVRRRVFQTDLPRSFGLAQRVILAPVFRKKDALADRETLQPEEVAASIRAMGGNGHAATSFDEIVEILTREVQKGDVVVFMSNGGFGGVPKRVKESLETT